MFKAAGAISDEELMTFRRFGSRLEGHRTPVLPWVDVATGSLGQGLPIGVGIALAGKRPLDAPYRVWVLCGDSETAEGSIWEAFDHAGHEGLSNLVAILDINRLGQRGPTELGWDLDAYASRVRAFGVDPLVIDGHDLPEVGDAFTRRPSAVRARGTAADRFFEMYIAEQQMVAAAVGMQVVGLVPFASTFAAFFTRAYDFIRMAAISRANIRLSGSHAGVSIGEDGPSQMALEDLAMMRAVYGSTVLYPSDPNQTAQLVAEMAQHSGIVYMRTTREKLPVLYSADEKFTVGGSKVIHQSNGDQATIVAAGITLHEALKAYEQLRSQRITV